MADAMAAKEAYCKMIRITSFTTMRSQDKCIETTLLPPVIEGGDVGEHKIDPMAIRRVLFGIPIFGNRILPVEPPFCFAFIIDAVKSDNPLEENMKLGVAARILSNLK